MQTQELKLYPHAQVEGALGCGEAASAGSDVRRSLDAVVGAGPTIHPLQEFLVQLAETCNEVAPDAGCCLPCKGQHVLSSDELRCFRRGCNPALDRCANVGGLLQQSPTAALSDRRDHPKVLVASCQAKLECMER
jgi:hypothetical protein